MAAHWGYTGEYGPNRWHLLYPAGKGRRQSPIDIDTSNMDKKVNYNLVAKYNPKEITSLNNNGHSVTFVAEGASSVISGDPLKNEHKLVQFHFHWGSEDNRGSEHTLNGKHYSAEVHLVHQNTKYPTFEKALDHGDGLCVVGAFLEVSDGIENPAYDKLTELLKTVQFKGEKHNFDGGFDAWSLLPESKTFVSCYDGSLTTPPLSECVQWVNLLEPVKISKKHIAAFRSLRMNAKGEKDLHLADNYRPVQELHGRCVCFHKH
ncbi:carbonic anhydrase 2-like isoform X2 [Clavelina lepadiformis]|uniref:Carbonic anhydrase n=1 Tax=Clavelina lepadiformis TaxID=159417 RepID=A0ABP0FT46_CLALP